MPAYTRIERAPDAFQQPVALEQLIAICRRAFGEQQEIIAIHELQGGGFNNTYRVQLAQEQPVILRVAPRPDRVASTAEATLLRQEHVAQGFLAPLASLLPKTLMADFTRQLIDRDYVFQTYMEGEQWRLIYDQLSLDENRSLWRQLGAIARTIHTVVGPAFGSLYSGPHYPMWSQAVIADLDGIIRDLEVYAGLDASDLRVVREIAHTQAACLDEIKQPFLRHGDLWTVNILIRRDAEGARINAVLDAEGASWGDPLADWTIFLLQLHRPAGSDAFWETYALPERDTNEHIRELIYYCQHLGTARLECWRKHIDDAVLRSYKDIHKTILELRTLTA